MIVSGGSGVKTKNASGFRPPAKGGTDDVKKQPDVADEPEAETTTDEDTTGRFKHAMEKLEQVYDECRVPVEQSQRRVARR